MRQQHIVGAGGGFADESGRGAARQVTQMRQRIKGNKM